jgi:hypothetical protein
MKKDKRRKERKQGPGHIREIKALNRELRRTDDDLTQQTQSRSSFGYVAFHGAAWYMYYIDWPSS